MAAGEILERGLRGRVRWIEGRGKEEKREKRKEKAKGINIGGEREMERNVERRRERDRVNGALFTLAIGA